MTQTQIRKWLNENQKWIAVIVVLLLAGVLWWVWRNIQSTQTVAAATQYYFYDISTKQLSVRPATDLPPLKDASGKAVIVRAIFVTCTTCGNRRLAYLMKYNSAARAAKKYLDHPPGSGAPQRQIAQFAAETPTLKLDVANGTLVRLLQTGSPWYYSRSPEGSDIIRKAMQCPGGRFAQTCQP